MSKKLRSEILIEVRDAAIQRFEYTFETGGTFHENWSY